MQTEAESVRRMLGELGEPTLEVEAAALQAMLARLDAPQLARQPVRRPFLRRAPVLVAIAVVVLFAAVAALAGVGGLFDGAPAPPAVQRELNPPAAAPTWASNQIVTARARELMRAPTAKGDLVLWIAPTRDGNICLALQHPGELRLGPACLRPDQPAGRIGYTVDEANGDHDGTYDAVWGRVPPGTSALSVTFTDGTTKAAALSHGFFIATIGERTPTLLVARSGSGAAIARQRVEPPLDFASSMADVRTDGTPRAVAAKDVRVLIRRRTWAGVLKLSTGPSIYGGPCTWTSIGSKLSTVSCDGSLAVAHPLSMGFSMAGAHDRQLIVFSGVFPADRLSGARFRFQDGRVLTLRPTAGHILWAFPPITSLEGHRPTSYDLLGPDGRVVQHQSLSGDSMFSEIVEGAHGPKRIREIRAWSRTHRW